MPQHCEKAALKCCQIPHTLASTLDTGGVGTKGASQFLGDFETMQLSEIRCFSSILAAPPTKKSQK